MRAARPGPTRRVLLLAGAVLATCGPAWAGVPEPEGYHPEPYNGETPATLNGAAALTTAEAKALWAGRTAIFIDVLPHPPKPQGLPAGTIWHEKPHGSIAGAHWLPEVGRGALAAETEAYYRRSLDDLTGRDASRLLVLFCKRNCWMSWNAAKRAVSYGYTNVRWYADGVDGWSEAGLPTEEVKPRT